MVSFQEGEQDLSLRQRLQEQAAELGAEEMLLRLAAIDPPYAATLHPNNLGRVLRALELYERTGITMTRQRERSRQKPSP